METGTLSFRMSPLLLSGNGGDKELSGSASFENIGYAVLDGAKSPEKPYLFIAGFSEDTFNTLPVRLISGRMPENSKEVLVPAHIAIKGGVQVQGGRHPFPLPSEPARTVTET